MGGLNDATEPVPALLPGLRIQFARVHGATVAAATSDNYSIHGTTQAYDTSRLASELLQRAVADLDADSVRALEGEFETWHAFHLARQETLFLEGRRMSDLGIRLPMMLREIDQNPNIDMGSPGTRTSRRPR